MKQIIQYICLALVTSLVVGLGAVFFEWFDERPALCLDQVITLGEYAKEGYHYPQQRVTLEKGVTHMLAVCRCKP